MFSWFLVLLFVSVSLFLAWYVRELLKRFRFLSDNSFVLREKVERYGQHLQSVYELPTFYGDETLRGLIQHILEANEEIEEIKEKYSTEEGQYEGSLEEESLEEVTNFDPADQEEA